MWWQTPRLADPGQRMRHPQWRIHVFPAHMRKRNQMDLTRPNPLTGGPTIGQWRACYCSQGQGWGPVR